jgi:hypothetical protein
MLLLVTSSGIGGLRRHPMIKPQDVVLFTEEETAAIAALEIEIDKAIRAGHGNVEVAIAQRSDPPEPLTKEWNEVARRYTAAGWIVTLDDNQHNMRFKHLSLVFYGDQIYTE